MNVRVSVPYHLFTFASFLQQLTPRIERLRKGVVEPHFGQHLQVVPYPCQLSASEAIPIVHRAFDSIQSALQEKLGEHSAYYWLHVYRRLAPENAFHDKLVGTVALYRRTLELAFLKYGRLQVGDEFVAGDRPEQILKGQFKRMLDERGVEYHADPEQLYLGPFGFEEFEEFHGVECLGHALYYCTSLLRWLYKGAKLEVLGPATCRIRPSFELSRLVRSFDSRNERYSWLATPVGIPITSVDRNKPTPALILVPSFNINRVAADQLGYQALVGEAVDDPTGGAPNFSWHPLDLGTFTRRHSFLAEQFQRKHCFSLSGFSSFIASVCWNFLLKLQSAPPDQRWNTLQRAYVHGTLPRFIEAWLQTSAILGMPIEPEELQRIIGWVSASDESRKAINLWTRGPSKLIWPVESDRVVVDFLAIPELLRDSIRELQKEVKDWGKKGRYLEDFAAEHVSTVGQANVWEKTKILRGLDGSEREIDIGILVGDVLFVVDCHAVSMSLAFDQGRPEALQFRKTKMEEKLKRVDSLAQWLMAHPQGTNYRIPLEARRIVPLVVSAFVEYIWSREQNLWSTDEIPRVCTVGELHRLISNRELVRAACSRTFSLALTK